MNRIETAIQQACCVFVLGDNATSPEVQQELSARNIPFCLLDQHEETSEETGSQLKVFRSGLGPALNSSSGMIVVVAPSFMELAALAGLIATAQPRPRLLCNQAMNNLHCPASFSGNSSKSAECPALHAPRGSSPETGLADWERCWGAHPCSIATRCSSS